MEWALSVVTAPTEEPVTLTEAKAHLRVDGSDEDAGIRALIATAREMCEPIARRAFVAQTLKMHFSSWPECGYLQLMRPPLVSVTHIKYYDADSVLQTMPSTDYLVDVASAPGRVWLGYGKSWPSATLRPGLPIEITYVAGHGDAAQVDRRYRQAMLLLIGHWYENREQVVVSPGTAAASIPWAVDRLLTIGRGSY